MLTGRTVSTSFLTFPSPSSTFLPLAVVSVQFPSGPLEALEDSGELVFSLTSDKRAEIAYEVKVSSVLATGSAAPATGMEVQAMSM